MTWKITIFCIMTYATTWSVNVIYWVFQIIFSRTAWDKDSHIKFFIWSGINVSRDLQSGSPSGSTKGGKQQLDMTKYSFGWILRRRNVLCRFLWDRVDCLYTHSFTTINVITRWTLLFIVGASLFSAIFPPEAFLQVDRHNRIATVDATPKWSDHDNYRLLISYTIGFLLAKLHNA